MLDIYTKLHPTGAFEIVFVIVRDADFSQYFKQIPTTAHKHFLQTFPSMPWPAIPLSDRKTCKRLETFFAISGDVHTSPRSIIIDPTGVVLHCDPTPLFLRYGAAAFPFTSDRIQFLDSEDDVIKKQPPSVKELLASSERDFLINNKGEQVYILLQLWLFEQHFHHYILSPLPSCFFSFAHCNIFDYHPSVPLLMLPFSFVGTSS